MKINYQLTTYKRYSVWVYKSKNKIQVYNQSMPNTEQLWFEFYDFDYVSWKQMQDECVDVFQTLHEKVYLYNFNKLKMFYLKRMFRDSIFGKLSFEELLKLHPRIIHGILRQIRVFDDTDEQEERRLAKQSAILFGNGNPVNNPHPAIVLYCDLTSFWQKFGLNYYDIQKLPKDTFNMLKRVMQLDSSSKKTETSSPSRPSPRGRGTKGVPIKTMRF